MTSQNSRPTCYTCRYFFITYEPSHPYGCSAMSFKAKELPATVVYKNSGMECQKYAKKPQRKKQ